MTEQEIEAVREEILTEPKNEYPQCDHPNSYTYYAMGDPGTKCPDCGWAN